MFIAYYTAKIGRKTRTFFIRPEGTTNLAANAERFATEQEALVTCRHRMPDFPQDCFGILHIPDVGQGDMAKAQDLALQADHAAKFRGHRLGPWTWHRYDSGKVVGVASCPDCDMTAEVDTRPAPNGIDISGEAVALNCTD